MNKRNLIFALLACMSIVMLILPMFLEVWTASKDGQVLYGYGLFNNFINIKPLFVMGNGKFYGYWATMVSVIAVIALLAGLGFVVLCILQLLRPKKRLYNFWRRIMSYVLLGSFLLSLMFGLAFILSNKYYYNILNISSGFVFLKASIGFYMLIIGTLLSGVFGLISTLEKRRKKNVQLFY